MSGMYPLPEKKQLKSIQVMHFRYLKYLLYLHRFHTSVSKYGATDISVSIERLNTVLADNAFYFAGLFPPANPNVLPLMVVIFVQIEVFCFFFLVPCLCFFVS